MALARTTGRLLRILGKAGRAMIDTRHPVLAHLIPMRRCNLACSYCNEFDAVSAPVPLDVVQGRVDKLADLGTAAITISGGEPLMHPGLDGVIGRIRERGMVATLISNGYHLSRERIGALNEAGLDHLEISIDNVEPDDVSKKSLRLLEPKLRWLAEHARFSVAINSVVGSGVRNPEDALTITRRARELGFLSHVGVIHDGQGQLRPMAEREMAIYNQIREMSRSTLNRFSASFQDRLARGQSNEWRCRAGARYLYVDENGIVSYCSQQRGRPGIPLERYTVEDIRREFDTRKDCAPFCTVNCVQWVGIFDNWRAPQRREMPAPAPGADPAMAV